MVYDFVRSFYRLSVGKITLQNKFQLAVEAIFEKNVLLAVSGSPAFYLLDISGGEKRQVQESITEKGVRSSKEGFVENLWTNIALIRNIIKDTELKVETIKLGQKTKTKLAIVYLNNLADPKIVAELKRRLSTIDTDSILGSGYIEQFIEDNPRSIFPHFQGTEKPDKAAGNILEGRISIIVDGTPMVLIVPALFIQFFHSVEDYNEKPFVGTFVRLLRVIAFLTATTAMAAYIALTTFHQELIPSDLLISLAIMRKKVPFPPLIEALLMEFVIEVLREAGIRLPSPVAATLGVAGGIILGDAAIRSNLVSPAVIIVTTFSTICTFSIPNYSMSIAARLIRLLLMFLSAFYGAYGIALGWLVITIHLTKQNTLGIPYFSTLAPIRYKDIKDSIIRLPLWLMKERPVSIPQQDRIRLKNNREKIKNGKQ